MKKILIFVLVILWSTLCWGQYYRSNRQAYNSIPKQKIERKDGPHWTYPHYGCMMCLGNHLITTHGQSYNYLESLGYSQWTILHDNLHNGGKKQVNKNKIFVPTPQDVVDYMLKLAKIRPNDIVCDLGCGDGRIVITAAKKYGIQSVGYEINDKLVKLARSNVSKNNMKSLVKIIHKNVLDVDLSNIDVVTLYFFEELNKQLIPQFDVMKPGSRIISHAHPIPTWEANGVFNIESKDGYEHKVYLYIIPINTYGINSYL